MWAPCRRSCLVGTSFTLPAPPGSNGAPTGAAHFGPVSGPLRGEDLAGDKEPSLPDVQPAARRESGESEGGNLGSRAEGCGAEAPECAATSRGVPNARMQLAKAC